MLERRQLLSAAVSNVFAAFDGAIAAGKATDVPVQITSRDFTLPGGGKAMLGIRTPLVRTGLNLTYSVLFVKGFCFATQITNCACQGLTDCAKL